MKALRRGKDEGREMVSWWCAGCKCPHGVPIDRWQWNGDLEKPVLQPSVLVTHGDDTRCHCFVGCNGAQPGQIIFLGDSDHALAGQTVDMIDVEEHMVHDNWPPEWQLPEGMWRPD